MLDAKVIVALDTSKPAEALEFAAKVTPQTCKLKVGKELFTCAGPQLVEQLVKQGFDVFLDLKFHDIPNTVKKAVYNASQLGVWMLNVHAMGGDAMLTAAREAVDMAGNRQPFLIAVTVLTSLSDESLSNIGMRYNVKDQVERLAQISFNCGMNGLVCSAQEAKSLRQKFGTTPLLVTPGIRPEGSSDNDQKRIMTPIQAIADGASYLVIGRPITQHQNPAQALADINQSLA